MQRAIQKDFINQNIVLKPDEKYVKTKVAQNVQQPKKTQKKYDRDFVHEGNFHKMLLSETNKDLLPYIDSELDFLEYEGSVIFNQYIDRHSVFTIVSKIMGKLMEQSNYEEFAFDKDFNFVIDRYELLRSNVESLFLSQLFIQRRPQYVALGKMFKPSEARVIDFSEQI
ncbi:MAG: hypothetical protein ACK5LV_05460 [Lachnospirales bacterium]